MNDWNLDKQLPYVGSGAGWPAVCLFLRDASSAPFSASISATRSSTSLSSRKRMRGCLSTVSITATWHSHNHCVISAWLRNAVHIAYDTHFDRKSLIILLQQTVLCSHHDMHHLQVRCAKQGSYDTRLPKSKMLVLYSDATVSQPRTCSLKASTY